MTVEQAPVSVIIPCYCCGDTIGRAVASVAAQTVRVVEVILIDDCSGDGTLERILALKEEYPADWIHVIELTGNDGPGTARNVGWEYATQPYIAFLDADDSWHPQKIEIQYGWMNAHPEVALTGHACRVVGASFNEKDRVELIADDAAFGYVSPRQLLFSNRFPTRSVMLRRSLPNRFVRGKRHSEDFLLWCEICLDGYPCFRSEKFMAFVYKARYGEGGLGGDLWKMLVGQQDSYRRLRVSGRINGQDEVLLLLWSMIRYLRRLLVTTLRKTRSAARLFLLNVA